MLFTRQFWKEAAERAAKTAAQFGLVGWGATVFTDVGDVVPIAQGTGLAMLFGAVASLLTSVGSVAIGDKGTPSLVREDPAHG